MKYIIVSRLVPKGYAAITIFPFILVRKKYRNNKKIINHECIHIKQQIELLVIGFYLWYLIDYLMKLLKYRHQKTAYRNIIFEKEAYSNERDFNYLKRRKLYSYLR